MKTLKGPAIFLAQFISDEEPFSSLKKIAAWASRLGFVGIQLPIGNPDFIDVRKAAESKGYCDELKGHCSEFGIEITELSTHLEGQLIAVHPAYDKLFDSFAPEAVHNNPKARSEWASQQLRLAAQASANLGLSNQATFSGSLLWPYVYPWPQRSAGLVEEGFRELASRWLPILDVFDEAGVNLCYEIHPGEDLHDGSSFEVFLEQVNGHQRANILYDPSHLVLQGMNYLDFIDIYRDRIKMFHVKDAELNPSGRSGVYGGYSDWLDRPGRFRSLGDGSVDFKAIFSKLAAYDFDGWAVLEWECCLKNQEDGAKEGASFIKDHIIKVTDKAFDDFAASSASTDVNRVILGIEEDGT